MALGYILQSGNLFADAAISASSEQTLYPKENAQSFPVSDIWRSNSEVSGVYLDFDLGSAQSVDTVSITAHNLTSAATITIAAGATLGASTFSTTITWVEDQNTLVKNFASQSYRYWRVTLTDAANPDGYIQLGYVFGGVLVTLHKFRYGWRRLRETVINSLRSDDGVPMIGTARASLKGFEFDIETSTGGNRDTVDLFFRNLRREAAPLLLLPDTTVAEALVGRFWTDQSIEEGKPFARFDTARFLEDAIPISVIS